MVFPVHGDALLAKPPAVVVPGLLPLFVRYSRGETVSPMSIVSQQVHNSEVDYNC